MSYPNGSIAKGPSCSMLTLVYSESSSHALGLLPTLFDLEGRVYLFHLSLILVLRIPLHVLLRDQCAISCMYKQALCFMLISFGVQACLA
jgi:hypothetical protein